ncbi:metal ABC transporter ATP-binding protein [Geomonas subterranea]|uniref:Metal ABC transporter ATP-binding protein n=1 Tax=Geomonas subterranea TaxID=2847989 RepID=A0ABX8LIH1_9BACT|nr:metal ABC transporter ATP-binding protein [Geomonas subterranea]QXE90505.1 metal ABC transporter ATP-binding protein [Geomonas subterranea]QXM11418.1 metal ABC transporter ATP-binding protein [Geomonas subterranea]
MKDKALSVRNLCAGYHGTEVLQDISFSVNAGDYVGICGPNGSGKSTMIKILLSLLAPTSGEVSLLGTPQCSFDQWHRIGYLPQGLQFFNPHFPATVDEVVRLGRLSAKKFPRRFNREDALAVERTMEWMGISHIKGAMIGELSGGLRQRVLLARALVNDPSLLIMDEPTTALDPETRESFYKLIFEMNQEKKCTVLLVTHDTATIGKYASHLLYLDKKVIFYGSFDDFCNSPEMTGFFGEHGQHLVCHRH